MNKNFYSKTLYQRLLLVHENFFALSEVLRSPKWIRKEQQLLVEYSSINAVSVNCECLRIWAGTALSQTLSNGHHIIILNSNQHNYQQNYKQQPTLAILAIQPFPHATLWLRWPHSCTVFPFPTLPLLQQYASVQKLNSQNRFIQLQDLFSSKLFLT